MTSLKTERHGFGPAIEPGMFNPYEQPLPNFHPEHFNYLSTTTTSDWGEPKAVHSHRHPESGWDIHFIHHGDKYEPHTVTAQHPDVPYPLTMDLYHKWDKGGYDTHVDVKNKEAWDMRRNKITRQNWGGLGRALRTMYPETRGFRGQRTTGGSTTGGREGRNVYFPIERLRLDGLHRTLSGISPEDPGTG